MSFDLQYVWAVGLAVSLILIFIVIIRNTPTLKVLASISTLGTATLGIFIGMGGLA